MKQPVKPWWSEITGKTTWMADWRYVESDVLAYKQDDPTITKWVRVGRANTAAEVRKMAREKAGDGWVVARDAQIETY